MQKLIVTADDYGMCDVVDKAIDAGIENGIITTTNVMLNMETLHNAKDLRERYPHISVGVHWNVTTGKPISDPKEIPTLVDKNGVFWSIGNFKNDIVKGLFRLPTLKKNWKLNMNFLKRLVVKQIIGIHTKILLYILRHLRFLKRLPKDTI